MTSRLFWPLALVALGILLLLDNLGYLPGSAWGYVWPALLIFLGLSLLVRRGARPEPVEDSLSLDGATDARLSFKHGAGVLEVRGGAGPDRLFEGVFGGGLEKRIDRQGDLLEATLEARASDWTQFMLPWNWVSGARGFDWDVRLNPETRLALSFETGASDTRLDLTDLRVTDLRLQTGASSTRLALPARGGWTRVHISSGAASVRVTVPAGVAARIRGSMGVGSLDVDQARFPRRGGAYESADFETATNRVELDIEGGVGSVTVN
jgi:hypothetical protein